MSEFQQVNNWIIRDNCFSIKYDKYELWIEKLNKDVVCSIFKDYKKLAFNFPNFEKAFEFANEFMNQKDFDNEVDTFYVANNLKEKLSKIYNS